MATSSDEAAESYTALPHPRIAMVVFNDMHHDSRVVREAQSAMAAGADVRVFAFAGNRYPTGLALMDGVEVQRVPLITLKDIAGTIVRRASRARNRNGSGQVADRSAAPGAPRQETAAPAGGEVETASVRSGSGPVAWLERQAMRVDRVVRQFVFWLMVMRAVRAWHPDLVHAHDANTLMAVGLVARALEVPFVYDSHELWTKRNVSGSRPLASRLEGPMERYWIRRAAGVITVSANIAKWLEDHYRLKTTPTLVRNIPPLKGPIPGPSSGRLRALAGLGEDTSVIVYCGLVTFNRGIERGIEALPHLSDEVHYVIVGPGTATQLEVIDRLARSLGVEDRVHVVGAVPSEEVSAAIADADVSALLHQAVVLSYAFSLPNKLFESLHAGVPVLASDTPDIAALVTEYGFGQLVPADASPEVVAAALRRVIDDGTRFRRNAEAATELLNWQGEAQRLISLHDAALRTSKRSKA